MIFKIILLYKVLVDLFESLKNKCKNVHLMLRDSNKFTRILYNNMILKIILKFICI